MLLFLDPYVLLFLALGASASGVDIAICVGAWYTPLKPPFAHTANTLPSGFSRFLPSGRNLPSLSNSLQYSIGMPCMLFSPGAAASVNSFSLPLIMNAPQQQAHWQQ